MKKAKRKTPIQKTTSVEYRINKSIRAKKVRIVGIEGEQNNQIIPLQIALDIAREAELDLVEVAPNADPPVCRVMDYGKFIYEKTRKEREARKNQKKIEIKTLNLKPKISQFHRDIRVRSARKWLEEGKKVKVAVKFQGREIQYPEIGRELIEGVAEELKDIAVIEQQPNMEGWTMTLLLTPESAIPVKGATPNTTSATPPNTANTADTQDSQS